MRMNELTWVAGSAECLMAILIELILNDLW